MSKRQARRQSARQRWLILPAVGLAIVAVLMAQPSSGTPAGSGLTPEAQLERALSAGRPVLVFYHSLDCHSCVEMMDTVAEVYPEFEATVSLVDVNVHDPGSAAMIRWAGLRFIPTLVFVDRDGGQQVRVGMMTPEALRQALEALGG